jgi:hypothetical protein
MQSLARCRSSQGMIASDCSKTSGFVAFKGHFEGYWITTGRFWEGKLIKAAKLFVGSSVCGLGFGLSSD